MTPHTCHARGCDVVVAPRMLMCAPHWRRVPAAVKRDVWVAYRVGQERDKKKPSRAYLAATTAAIAAVALQEDAVLADAMRDMGDERHPDDLP